MLEYEIVYACVLARIKTILYAKEIEGCVCTILPVIFIVVNVSINIRLTAIKFSLRRRGISGQLTVDYSAKYSTSERLYYSKCRLQAVAYIKAF